MSSKNQDRDSMMENINPRIKQLIEETGTSLGLEDLEALANVSVKALTKLFEELSRGVSKEQALQDMKTIALQQLREKKQNIQQRQEWYSKRMPWIQSEESRLSTERQKVKDLKHQVREDLKEVREYIHLIATDELPQEELQHPDIKRAYETETRTLEKCSDVLDELMEEVVDAQTTLSQLKSLEEELKDKYQTQEIDQMLVKLEKIEKDYKDSCEEYQVADSRFKQLREEYEQAHHERVILVENPPSLEEHIEPPPPPEDGDDIIAGVDDVPPPPSDSMDSPTQESEPQDKESQENATSESAQESTSVSAQESTTQDSSQEQNESEEKESNREHDTQENSNTPEHEQGVSQESMAEIMKAIAENEDDEEETTSTTSEDKPRKDSRSQRSKSQSRKAVPQHRVSTSSISETQWLKPRFDVTKFDPKKKLFSKKTRTWEIDFFGGLFLNMTRKGKVKKSMTPGKLIQLEKNLSDLKRVRMQFFEAHHPYELVFSSNYLRERFYECASAIRPTQFVWCPHLCLEGEGKTKTEIQGTFKTNQKGKNQEVSGQCRINVTSQPYETLKVWCGTFSMAGRAPPKDLDVFRSWIPVDEYDIYAIGVQESGLSKEKDKLLKYMQSVLGRNYIALASLTLWDIELVVLCRKKHGMKITNVKGAMKATGMMNMGNKGSVAISLTFNETNLLFINSHMANNKGDKTPDSATDNTKSRNKNYSEAVDGLLFGEKSLDIFSQFHYIFWMGNLNYRVELPYEEGLKAAENKDVEKMLKYDQLIQQKDSGKSFVGFHEANIQFAPTYKFRKGRDEYRKSKPRTPSFSDRILWKSWPSCAIANMSYSSCDSIKFSDHRPVGATFKINTVRPFGSVFMPPSSRAEIVFEEVKLVGYLKKPINKPQLLLHSTWVESTTSVNASNSKPTLNVVWNNIPKIQPNTSHKEYLRVQHIVLNVVDRGVKVSDNYGNMVGSGVLSLKAAVSHAGQSVPFKIPTYAHGLQTAELEGTIRLSYV